MELLLPSYTIECGLALISIYLLYKYYNPFNYWRDRGVPYRHPKFFILNSVKAIRNSLHELTFDMYAHYPNERFYGSFNLFKPSIIIKDPELIECVLIKDFSHFYDRSNTMDTDTNALSKHLVNYHGEQWKSLRNKLTPTFTTGKLKGMHPQLINSAQSLVKYLSNVDKSQSVDMKDLCGRYSMDVIASCAFGLDLDIMNNPDNEFYKIGRKTFEPSYVNKCVVMMQAIFSPLIKKLKFATIPRKMIDFFINAVDQTLEYREKNNVHRPDFLHLMNELKKKDEELAKTEGLDPKDPSIFDHSSLVSNAFVFFAAGYETTGTTMGYLLYELAKDQDLQEKMYQHVVEVINKHNGEFSFEAIADMTYLDQAVSETLRIHSPAVIVDRKVTKDYRIPGTEVVIPAGVSVSIPALALHHDPQYFPEPEKFNPDRFDPEKNSIVKGTFLPFGAGPRVCIAARFARYEAKVCVALLLKNYKLKTTERTKIPIEYDSRSFLLVPKNGIWLSVEKRPASTK